MLILVGIVIAKLRNCADMGTTPYGGESTDPPGCGVTGNGAFGFMLLLFNNAQIGSLGLFII
jgi:hypothetical protein